MDGKLKEIADNYYAVTSVNDFDNSRDCEVLKHKYFMLGCELIYNEMRESQNASTSDEALPIGDVVKPLPTEFADWIADQDLYRYHDGWEIDEVKFDTDELYAEFLKCYPTWSANG
jgi:hypothetical protein